MNERPFTARILVLTEDKNPEPLRALVRSMLRLVQPQHDPARVDVQGDHPQAQEAATANLAKERRGGSGHRRRVEIARAIATEVFVESNFVFYHEVEKPKNAGCLNASHYLDLATREYPNKAVYAAGKSYAESVDRLSNCNALQSALAGAAFQMPSQ